MVIERGAWSITSAEFEFSYRGYPIKIQFYAGG